MISAEPYILTLTKVASSLLGLVTGNGADYRVLVAANLVSCALGVGLGLSSLGLGSALSLGLLTS